MADLTLSLLSLDTLTKNALTEQILKSNEYTAQYGLALTYADAVQLVEARSEFLRENGRIEIGNVTIDKIIDAFCDSSFISQEDYADTIASLLEIFYDMKNETLDLIADDELIELMKYYFEIRCKGSLEQLHHRELEKLARNLRFNVVDYANMDEFDTELYFGEDEY